MSIARHHAEWLSLLDISGPFLSLKVLTNTFRDGLDAPDEEWALRPAADLLKLTVCDMAMGSGAFLVQACRYLSERLLEAWVFAEGSEDDKRLSDPSASGLLQARTPHFWRRAR